MSGFFYAYLCLTTLLNSIMQYFFVILLEIKNGLHLQLNLNGCLRNIELCYFSTAERQINLGEKKMKKVVYSVTKVNKDEKLKGVGYLVEDNLLIPATSSKGNSYIKVFEDITKSCHQISGKDNEYKGYVTIAYEDVQIYNKQKNSYDTMDYCETTYFVWFKILD